jgi:hypothetical protein
MAAGMVLHRNDGVLPLPQGGSLAVIGRAAMEPSIQGEGSSQITPTMVDIPIDELRRFTGEDAISYAEGYDDTDTNRPELVAEAVEIASTSDAADLSDYAWLVVGPRRFVESRPLARRTTRTGAKQLGILHEPPGPGRDDLHRRRPGPRRLTALDSPAGFRRHPFRS